MNSLTGVWSALQYGSFGLLFVVVVYGLRLLSRLGDRLIASVDKLDDTLERIDGRAQAAALAAVERHALGLRETTTAITLAAKEAAERDSEASVLAERRHADVLRRVDEAGAKTRHDVRNALGIRASVTNEGGSQR